MVEAFELAFTGLVVHLKLGKPLLDVKGQDEPGPTLAHWARVNLEFGKAA